MALFHDNPRRQRPTAKTGGTPCTGNMHSRCIHSSDRGGPQLACPPARCWSGPGGSARPPPAGTLPAWRLGGAPPVPALPPACLGSAARPAPRRRLLGRRSRAVAKAGARGSPRRRPWSWREAAAAAAAPWRRRARSARAAASPGTSSRAWPACHPRALAEQRRPCRARAQMVDPLLPLVLPSPLPSQSSDHWVGLWLPPGRHEALLSCQPLAAAFSCRPV